MKTLEIYFITLKFGSNNLIFPLQTTNASLSRLSWLAVYYERAWICNISFSAISLINGVSMFNLISFHLNLTLSFTSFSWRTPFLLQVKLISTSTQTENVTHSIMPPIETYQNLIKSSSSLHKFCEIIRFNGSHLRYFHHVF